MCRQLWTDEDAHGVEERVNRSVRWLHLQLNIWNEERGVNVENEFVNDGAFWLSLISSLNSF